MALTKITNDLLDLGSDTGALGLPKGTEAQRPSNPVEGTLRHNSEIDETKLEAYDGTEWRKINEFIPVYSVDYLVVAGGGSGAAYFGGGAGAGGLRTSYGNISGGGSSSGSTLTFTPQTVYTIEVGGGGAFNLDRFTQAPNGSNSSLSGSGITTIESIGGGGSGDGGGGSSSAPQIGGSGGGGGSTRATVYTGESGTTGQGYAGGSSGFLAPNYPSAGGGGAAAIGQSPANASVTVAATGGNGLAVSITGSSIYYAGGGGGAIAYYAGGVGGLGGGGRGATGGPSGDTITTATSGTANTGGGGGGGSYVLTASPTGSVTTGGGSGVVILRMPTANYSGTTTGSPTVTTNGTDTILTYTQSGTYTA